MTIHRMDQETAERLLVGPVADTQDGPEVLIRLLAAVRAAPRPHELGGEGAAVQAFRAARAGLLPAASRTERRFVTSLLSAKLALAALLAAATGGVALAAATGTLPDPLDGGAGATTTPTVGGRTTPSPTTGPGTPSTASTAGPSDRPPGSPSSLAGLCATYRKAGEEGQRVLESPRFAGLVSAAGGREKVAGYCDRLLDGPIKPDRSRAPETGRPDPAPTGRPDLVPSTPADVGRPAVRSAVPTTHPASSAARLPALVGPSIR